MKKSLAHPALSAYRKGNETMHLIWRPHHSWSVDSSHVDGFIESWPGGVKQELDFCTTSGIQDHMATSVDELWPEIGMKKVMRTWFDEGVVVLPPSYPSCPHTILVSSPVEIPVMLSRLGIQMG